MPTYKVTDPKTGKIFETTREAPPSEQELEEIFAKMNQKPPESTQKQPVPVQKEKKEDNLPTTREETRYELAKAGREEGGEEETQDVMLDVPTLKVDEIRLKVDDLNAKVSLNAALANLVKISVGADVSIANVELDIKGVEAQALLKVRLKRVYQILARALETLDKNPDILKSLLAPVGEAVGEIGKGAGGAVGEIGKGAGGAVGEIGKGAGGAVGEIGEGAGGAVSEIGKGAGGAAGEIGKGAGGAVGEIGEGAGGAADEIGKETGQAVGELGSEAAKTAGPEGPVGETVKSTTGNLEETTKGATAQNESVAESLKGKTEDVDQAIKGEHQVKEKDRRYFYRKDKDKKKDRSGTSQVFSEDENEQME
ncbi:MAG: hypothetical protein GX089_16130 [Fibrobacter sp.]|nr:hypothetical protein [Fibrobacter sp.]